MSLPIPYFGHKVEGLKVIFTNLSFGNPTTYQWGFGDGSDSTLESPEHTYSQPGFYKVTLQVGNTEGLSEVLEMNVGVGGAEEITNLTLPELIDDYMPEDLLGSASISRKVNLISKWRLYLQPLVYLKTAPDEPAIEISPEDTHNEFAWPALFNYLIAQLVAYDIILQGANQFLANIGKAGSDTVSEETSTGQGNIKLIETGPAKTEWYDNVTTEKLENIGKIYLSATKGGGIIAYLKASICQLANRLRIYLPMCGQLDHNTTPPSVVTKTRRGGHNANPFGITKRML